jgi:hypothetical protein
MKPHTIFASLIVAASLLAGTSTRLAQAAIIISVDENAHGTLVNNDTGFNSPLPAALLPDPGPGGRPSALTYGLLNPPGLVEGDLILLETPVGIISDIIRFNPNQNGGSLVFYSDNFDGADALADTGFPSAIFTSNHAVIEVGPEGANGVTYTPTAGQPGFVTGAGSPVTYVITSDAVPEPCSLALAALGAIWGFTTLRRR